MSLFPLYSPVVGGGAGFRYYRLDITANGGGGTLIIAEFRLYTGASASGTEWPTSAMTSNSAPSPFVASASSEKSGATQAWCAFNDSNLDAGNQYWDANSTTGTLTIDLGEAVELLSYSLEESLASATDNAPGAWTMEGSNTGAFAGEETVLDTQTGITFSASEVKVFNL